MLSTRYAHTFLSPLACLCRLKRAQEKLKYFINAVTDQMIERCMISSLPESILSPAVVQLMTDEEVAYIAAEPPETVAQRAFLEERRQLLEKGKEIFREAMGGVKRGRMGR
jgi:hypothetical protein